MRAGWLCGLLLLTSGCSFHYAMRDLSECHDQTACLGALQQSIAFHWQLPDCATPDMSATVALAFPEEGPIPARIVKSSGYQEFDQSVLTAIRQASGDIELRGVTRHFRGSGNDGLTIRLVASPSAAPSVPACKPSFVQHTPEPAVMAATAG